MISLVGYTGFVGSNIYRKYEFDNVYNSKNIVEAYGTNPDILVYAGVRAEKFLANKYPDEDLKSINEAFNNIIKINPKKVILISTIDVYPNPVNVTEFTNINKCDLQPYGYNRLYLEELVIKNFKDYLIVRLPGLYGENLKKNFIYDLINIIPSMLTEQKYEELIHKDDYINNYYIKLDNGFYKCIDLNKDEKNKLKKYFENIGFSALNFTNSKASFQFYNLEYLWEHIQIAMKNNIKVLNIATEPVTTGEIFNIIYNKDFINNDVKLIPNYNYKTEYYRDFNGENGYLFDKKSILNDIKEFIKSKI